MRNSKHTYERLARRISEEIMRTFDKESPRFKLLEKKLKKAMRKAEESK